MSEIGEGLGSAIEGGMLARAVEKSAGEGQELAQGDCLNCGTKLIGAHCHACGQRAQVRRTLSAIIQDIIHGVLHLDGKFWRTLPLLTFKPGVITRRYIDGERAKFISPMAMFLFSIFLMFAIFQALGISAPTSDETEETRARLLERLEGLPADSPLRAEIQNDLDTLDTAEGVLDTAESVVLPGDGGLSESIADKETGVKWLDEGIIKKWKENPSLMLYKMQNNAYKFSWLLIPLSVPFVWLMFAWRRQFKAYDHAIFVTYSLSFMSLLFIALSILYQLNIGGGWIFLILAIVPPLHIYKHLRGTYSLSRFSALWRLVLLGGFINTVITLFLQILFLLGAF
jgi:hypothetical protein